MDTVALIGRLLLSLGVVLGVMWLIARRLRRSGRIKNGTVIDVLARQQLTRTSSVALVQVLDQALIIGVTDTSISVIGETDLETAKKKLEEQSPARVARPAAARATPRSAGPRSAGLRAAGSRPAISPSARVTDAANGTATDGSAGRLAGSAISPTTWRNTLEALRDLTARTR